MRRLGWSVLVLACSMLVGCDTGGDDDDGGADVDLVNGRDKYIEYCAFCHGEQGEGYVSDNANALANEDFLKLATDDFLRAGIIYGRPGTPMSGWGVERSGPLTDQDVEDMVAYLRTAQDQPSLDVHDDVVEGSENLGKTVYTVYCETCHGPDGRGGEFMTLENPWFLNTASDGFLRESIRRGRPGTPMPGYQDELTSQQIDDIVVYLRSLERPVDTDPIPPYEPDVSGATINPDGPEPSWDLREDRFVAVDDVKAALDAGEKMILLDARAHSDHLDGHITDSVSVPFFQLEGVIDDLPQDTWIVSYCGCPHAISGQAFDALAAAGFTKIAVLDEGYYVWEERGYPVTYPE